LKRSRPGNFDVLGGCGTTSLRRCPTKTPCATCELSGRTEGQTFFVERRYTSGEADLQPALAEELVRRKVELTELEIR